MTLNDPVGYEPEAAQAEWTPGRAVVRGLAGGALVFSGLLGLTLPLAWVVPHLLIGGVPRTALAFCATWLTLHAVCRFATLEAVWCRWAAAGFTALLLLAHHAGFALAGVPDLAGTIGSWWLFPAHLVATLNPPAGGTMAGWIWFHPLALLAVNAAPALLGVASCLWLHARD